MVASSMMTIAIAININALSLGVNYTILRQFETNLAIGAQGSRFMEIIRCPGKFM
jgi:hypothetical protein